MQSRNFLHYQSTLAGRYARLPLLLAAVLLLLWFGYLVATQQTGFLGLVASLVLSASLVTSIGPPWLRVILLVAMCVNMFAAITNPIGRGNDKDVLSTVLNYGLLSSLLIASIFEFVGLAKSSSRAAWLKGVAWSVLAIPAMIYILGIPVFDYAWTTVEADQKKIALKDPKWNVLNEATFRAAKFMVFAVFAYLGACLGSFLNVVAYCIPRGERIGLRSSSCPRCDTKIGRVDNLPIFSFVNLGAKCRNCSASISARYLAVELVGGAIFGSLFLYQLVTGCINVPEMHFFHTGVLWMILYPKWPAIGIYFYHVLFMCAVLVLALIEWDRQPLKFAFAIAVALMFFLPAAFYLPIQPVPLDDHLPAISNQFSALVEQLLKLTVGGVLGAALGRSFKSAFSASHPAILTFAFSLTGIVLGWQALAQVTVFFVAVAVVVRLWPRASDLLQARPTAILLAAIAIHHPFWDSISQWWRFS